MTTRTEPTPHLYVAADGRTIASRGPLDVYEKHAFAESTENADLIVRAVNSHAALVEALEKYRDAVQEMWEDGYISGDLSDAFIVAEVAVDTALVAAKVTKNEEKEDYTEDYSTYHNKRREWPEGH